LLLKFFSSFTSLSVPKWGLPDIKMAWDDMREGKDFRNLKKD
jgi:hypothetical protein